MPRSRVRCSTVSKLQPPTMDHNIFGGGGGGNQLSTAHCLQRFHTHAPPHGHVALGTVLFWVPKNCSCPRRWGLDNVILDLGNKALCIEVAAGLVHCYIALHCDKLLLFSTPF